MNFIENIKEVLLGLVIAITLPILTYWAIETYYSYTPHYNSNVQIQRTQSYVPVSHEKNANEIQPKINKVRELSFWPYFIVAILSIIAGAFIKIHSLSIGLIGGGIINLFFSIFNLPNTPIVNLGIFLFLFIILILMTVIRKRY